MSDLDFEKDIRCTTDFKNGRAADPNNSWITVIWFDGDKLLTKQLKAATYMADPKSFGYPNNVIFEGQCQEVRVEVAQYTLTPKKKYVSRGD